MKRLIATIFLLGAACTAQAVDRGAAAPEAAGPGLIDGKPVALTSMRGKVVLLDFWASWCGPCKVSLPEMDALRKELHAQGLASRFEVLAVNVDAEPKDGQRFLKAHPVGYPVLSDPAGKVPEAYALPTMPSSYLIAPDGKVALVHEGYRPGDAAKMKAQILALLGVK